MQEFINWFTLIDNECEGYRWIIGLLSYYYCSDDEEVPDAPEVATVEDGQTAMEKLESARVVLDKKINFITNFIDSQLLRESTNIEVVLQVITYSI